jgi:plastocyanin
MVGYVVVKAKGQSVPSATQDATALKQQLTAGILAAGKLLKTKLPANLVSLGLSTSQGVELYSMFPATLKVKVGTVVTFSMSKNTRETHTATFGPSAYLKNLSNGLGPPGPATNISLYPSSPAGAPIPLAANSHGNGFANTGGLDEDPTTPLPPSNKIQFMQPGTYTYICVIHPFMVGTVVVTP